MTTATIVGVGRDPRSAQVYMAVRVDEGGKLGSVEYSGSVPDDERFEALSNAQKKAALVAACKAVRDAAIGATPAALPIMAGTVTL